MDPEFSEPDSVRAHGQLPLHLPAPLDGPGADARGHGRHIRAHEGSEWRRPPFFWVKVYGLIFAIGLATGIVQEFEFGTNWADYSRFVGNVFGSLLAAEGLRLLPGGRLPRA